MPDGMRWDLYVGGNSEDIPYHPVYHPFNWRGWTEFGVGALGDMGARAYKAETSANLRRLIADAGADLRTRPEPAEWSVVELIGHMIDAELDSSARYRWILAEDEPDLVPYDQDRGPTGSTRPSETSTPLLCDVRCPARREPARLGAPPRRRTGPGSAITLSEGPRATS